MRNLHLRPVSIMNFFFMLGISFVLTFDQTLFLSGYQEIRMYRFFLSISPQEGYGVAAFLIAVILFAAFILKNYKLEIAGLSLSGLMLVFILSGYLLSFPNIGAVAFFIWTLASFMTIVELYFNEQDRKIRRLKILQGIQKAAIKKQIVTNSEIPYNKMEKLEQILLLQEADEKEYQKVLEAELEDLKKESYSKERG